MFVNTQIPGESAKMFRNKIPFLFLRMFRILPFFFNYFHDPNSISGWGNHFSRGFGWHSITQDEKAWWQGCLERPELQGTLMRCFRATMFFRFADAASVGKSLLDGIKDHLLNQTRSERTCETRTSSGISQQLYRWTSARSLCSKIGIGERPWRKYWVSTRAFKTARRINYNGKSCSKNLEKKCLWDGKKNRAQELRVEEFSVHNLREGHETNTEAHFIKTINARANEFWIVQMNFKKRNQITVEDCFTFPVNRAIWHMKYVWTTGNVFGNYFSTVDSPNHYQGIHHVFTLGSTGPTKYCTTLCMLQAQGLISQDMEI